MYVYILIAIFSVMTILRFSLVGTLNARKRSYMMTLETVITSMLKIIIQDSVLVFLLMAIVLN